MKIIIPENDVIPEFGEFEINDIVTLLRKYCNNADAICFIAAMLEE